MPSKKTTMIQEESMVEDQDQKAVLIYRVGQLEKTTALGLKEIKEELHNLQNSFATTTELHEFKKSNNERITKLESWNEWAVKIVLGAVFMAVLALVIVKSPTIGG
jgi:cob(I)alamin adenosyltransferase